VSDADRSLDFYGAAFGFAVTGQIMRNDAGAVMHAGMRLGETAIMFSPPNPSSEMQPPASSGAPDSLTLYVYVPDVDALASRAERAGARVLQRPADQFWGDRIAVFRDPDGYHWTFATNVGEFDSEKAPKG
jgi:PhnB protein